MSGRGWSSPVAKVAGAALFIVVLLGTSIWVIREFVIQPKQTINFSPDEMKTLQQAARPAGAAITDTGVNGPPTFHGTVVDAQSHLPIATFVVRVGYQYPGSQPYYYNQSPQVGHNGKYEFPSRFMVGGNANYLVRIEAAGHFPAVSAGMKGSGTADFELQPGKDVRGSVVDAAGAPVAKAVVVLAAAGIQAEVDPRDLKTVQPQTIGTLSRGDGRFTLPPQIGATMLAAYSAAGYGRTVLDDPTAECRIRLAPWGRIEGQLIIAGKPAAKQSVTAVCYYGSGASGATVYTDSRAETDADGKFQFTRFSPGEVDLARQIRIPYGRGYATRNTQTVDVTLAAGQTLTVKIGGVGRPVTGRLVLPVGTGSLSQLYLQCQVNGTSLPELPPQMPESVRSSSPEARAIWLNMFQLTAAGSQWVKSHPQSQQRNLQYTMELVGDKGQFKIDDVVAGDYHIYCYMRPMQGGRLYGPAQVDFTMPPVPGGGYSDKPLVLPDIVLQAR
jgi:hypothetical protein